MKRNLVGLFISLLIHGGLLLFVTYGLAAEKPIVRQFEKPVPLRLAMFQEVAPVVKPIAPQVRPSVKPQPQPIVTPRPQPIVKQKPLIKPKKKQRKQKPTTKKISKKTPKKMQTKTTKKKKAPKTKKTTIQKNHVLDEMIHAYQAAQRNAVSPLTQPSKTNTSPPPISKPQPARTSKKQSAKTAAKKPTNKQAEQQYKARLQRLIAQQKTYPARARRQHKEGTVIVSFTISPNGTINQISIKQSSGNNILDNAALKTIRRTSGRLAFPPTIQRKQWQFTLPLVYQLR